MPAGYFDHYSKQSSVGRPFDQVILQKKNCFPKNLNLKIVVILIQFSIQIIS